MEQNILDKPKLISELRGIHNELVNLYNEIFNYKFTNNKEFSDYIKEQYNQNNIKSEDRKAWNENFCHRASYTLLNKILFVRICEDKGFMRNSDDYIAGEIGNPHIGEKLSKRGLQKWTSIITNSTFGELINFAFLDMKESYNNIVLYKDNKYEILNPTDEELDLKYTDGNQETKKNVLEFENVLSNIIEKLDTERFNFAETDSNILGDVYEQFMDRETRKAIGQFYTPEFVIEYILKNTVLEADVVENPFVTVADISCGSGHFLIMAYDTLKDKFIDNLEELKERYYDQTYKIKKDGKEEEISGSKYWVEENIHYHLLKHCIYGADIDSFAVQLTTINLLLKDLDNFTDELNIMECNSLIKWEEDYDWEDFKKQLEQDFEIIETANLNFFGEEEIVEIKKMKDKFKLKSIISSSKDELLNKEEAKEKVKIYKFWMNKYDYVIGNPPYIRYEKINQTLVDYIKERYETAYKFFDIFSMFIERNIDICKEGKCISLITPNLYIKGFDYHKLRKYILENSKNIELNDLGDGVFADVEMPTAIINIYKDKRKIIKGDVTLLDDNIIVGKMKRNDTLEEMCQIQRGLELGKSALSNKEHKNNFKILTGEDIDRYGIKSFKYIDESLILENNKNEKYFNLDRVLIRETGNRITTVFIDEKIYSLRSLYSIIPNTNRIDPRALSGILNSDLIQYFYLNEYKSNTDTFPKIRIGQVKKIPIFTNNAIKLRSIEHKVNEIQSKKEFLLNINIEIKKIILKSDNLSNTVSILINLLEKRDIYTVEIIELEENINNLVYELYGINETEILEIKKELEIKDYNANLKELESMLCIDDFLKLIKKYNFYQIEEIYSFKIKAILQLRDKYKDTYKEKARWDFYNTEDVFETVNIIIKETIEFIFKDEVIYANTKNIIDSVRKYLFTFDQLVNIVRYEKHNTNTNDIVIEALNTDVYTWNAYRKAKKTNKVNKTFIKYYDSIYYGLSEWSDEIHKQYFMDAIEEYTVTEPNEKKANDILKLFKDLDIEDKQDYLEIIEDKINRAFK